MPVEKDFAYVISDQMLQLHDTLQQLWALLWPALYPACNIVFAPLL
jgi:hypothetical protein